MVIRAKQGVVHQLPMPFRGVFPYSEHTLHFRPVLPSSNSSTHSSHLNSCNHEELNPLFRDGPCMARRTLAWWEEPSCHRRRRKRQLVRRLPCRRTRRAGISAKKKRGEQWLLDHFSRDHEVEVDHVTMPTERVPSTWAQFF